MRTTKPTTTIPRDGYRGIIADDGTHKVEVNSWGRWEPLPQRQDVVNHSPTGLSWGYGGSGPAQLALALLCDAVGQERAVAIYQDFKERWVAGLDPTKGWKMDYYNVGVLVRKIERERGIE